MPLLTSGEICQLIGPFAFCSALGGLIFGIFIRKSFEVDQLFSLIMLIVANAIGMIIAIVISAHDDLSTIAYETMGSVMALCFLAGFLALGVLISKRIPGR
jgi:hypothetical protein